MKVLVACERSGIVREAFRARGHDAWSCDLVESDQAGNHIVADVREVLDQGWNLMVAHPPCTYLAYSGARWFNRPGRMELAREAFRLVLELWNAPIPAIAIENPRGLLSKWLRRADQVVQPWYFGDPMTKETHLWLKNLPPLMASVVCVDRFVNWTEFNRNPVVRSQTFKGLAVAMAQQWGWC